jgi:hypothetical protein
MQEDKVMTIVGTQTLTPTVFTKEELKDVKYLFHGNYIIVTHPMHPLYRVKMGTFEFEQFNGIEFKKMES